MRCSRLTAFFRQAGGQEIEAVGQRVPGQGDSGGGANGGGDINGGNQVRGYARLDACGPADDEGDAVAAFPELGFFSAIGSGGFVAALVIDVGAVVAAVDDEGVLGEAEAVEGLEDFADRRIELVKHVGAIAEAAGANKARVGDGGRVNVMRGEEQEEFLFLVALKELDAFAGVGICDLGVLPPGGLSALRPTDAVAACGHFGHVLFLRFAFVVGVVDRVVGIEVQHAVIAHKYGGDAVVGGGDAEEFMEADFQGAGPELLIVVGCFLAEAQRGACSGLTVDLNTEASYGFCVWQSGRVAGPGSWRIQFRGQKSAARESAASPDKLPLLRSRPGGVRLPNLHGP